jgi:hypothetical protein
MIGLNHYLEWSVFTLANNSHAPGAMVLTVDDIA